MKRKLSDRDDGEALDVAAPPAKQQAVLTFQSLGLDPRILAGVQSEKFSTPTPVQAKAIPLALEGKDMLARSKTGSGKTAAYALPILQSILERKTDHAASKSTSALILVPTRELAGQVTKAIEALASGCGQLVHTANLTRQEDDKVLRARLAELPDIVVATPFQASKYYNSSALSLDGIAHLVVDEADLVLSYEGGEDLESIRKGIPKDVQTFMMSATLSSEVDKLKAIFCRDPVVLEFDEEEKSAATVSQFMVKCAEDEKFLLIYAIFKLGLIKGKAIIFVGDLDRCYRLKLYLEQFGIKSCILNSELPVNSRIHVVEEFNKNVYDIIIATDEHEVLGDEDAAEKPKVVEVDDEPADSAAEGAEDDEKAAPSNGINGTSKAFKGKQRASKRDKEYGVARGIDFKNVACVLNFDLPTTSKSYTHRIGRTARAGKSGMALSFCIPKEYYRKHKSITLASTEHDEDVLAKITKRQKKKGLSVQPYHFDQKALEGLRYRTETALQAVGTGAVREARVRELRQELIKSEKLKRHFEENPGDLKHLRHDGEMQPKRVMPHLKHVPDYLLPAGGRKAVQDAGFVGIAGDERSGNRIRKARQFNKSRGKGAKAKARKANPLQTFKARGKA